MRRQSKELVMTLKFQAQENGFLFLAAAGIRHHSSADGCITSQQLGKALATPVSFPLSVEFGSERVPPPE